MLSSAVPGLGIKRAKVELVSEIKFSCCLLKSLKGLSRFCVGWFLYAKVFYGVHFMKQSSFKCPLLCLLFKHFKIFQSS